MRVYVLWLDSTGKTKGTLAQNWIRRSGTKNAMYWDWVFAGSKIYKDDDGKEHYLGDSGELISVSNFATSTMDVAVRSEQSNANLIFEAFTERIPPKYTPVRLAITLTDEAPFGSSDSDSDPPDDSKVEPKFLTAKVPDNIMKFLSSKPAAESNPENTDGNSSKNPPPKTEK